MAEQESFVQGFKNFVLRGNVIDLAVAVVIGTAFTALVTSLTKNVITPLLSAIGGKQDFSHSLIGTLNGSQFLFGAFLTDLINFVILALVVYTLIVRPVNALMTRFARGEEQAEVTAPDPQLVLLSEIRDALVARS